MSNAQLLALRIKHFRKINSLTQKQLADKMGVAPLYIANIEQGRKGISLDKLIELCNWFNIGLSDLLPIENQAEPETKEEWINDITGTLRLLDTEQVGLIKTMVCSLRNQQLA